MNARIKGQRHAVVFALVLLAAGLALVDGGIQRADAVVTAVNGEACTYSVKVGLFGGPQTTSGCNEGTSSTNTGPIRPPGPNTPPTSDSSYSPHVKISGSGGTMSATDANGAKATYGPAVIHGGMWPCEDKGTDTVGGIQDDNVNGNCPASTPSSGPQAASTTGSATSGTVSASADISLFASPVAVTCYAGWGPNPPSTAGCRNYGGFGPFPVWGESLHAECTATETSATGSATFVNAWHTFSTDVEGEPVEQEPIPNNPPINYTRSGVITNVGDVFTTVYNQHIVNADGSLTVNAVHMYLFGPTAVGEMVRGQVTCGTTPSMLSKVDTVAPTCGVPVVAPEGPEDPTPKVPAQVLIGVFDAGGLQSVSTPVMTNGTAEVGRTHPNDDGSAPLPYLQFSPGQTGPLIVTATRSNESQPMTFSFVATDKAGNATTVNVNVPNVGGKATPTATCQSTGPGGSTTTTGPGGTTSTSGAGGTTSTTGGSNTTSTTGSTGTTSTTSGTGTTSTTVKAGDVTVSPSTVAPGGTIQVSSTGWMPEDDVTAVLKSDPVTLGTTAANTAGAVSGSFTIPVATPTGAHTLELTGTGASGSARTVSAPLTVAASTGTGTGGTSTGGTSTGGTSTGGTSSSSDAGGAVQGGALSRTGFNLAPFASLAALSFLIGSILVIAARRRRLADRG